MKTPFDRGGLRYYLVIIALLAGHPTAASVAAGTAILLSGVFLHVWAKGCLRQNQEVTSTGPYRFVRHPFYTANALVDAGIAVMSASWLLCLALPVWWLAVYIPVIRSEERYLCAAFGPAYGDYRSSVSMLLPLKSPLPAGAPGFSWHSYNIAAGREIPRALRIAAYPLLFLMSLQIRDNGLGSLHANNSPALIALAAFAMLHALARMFERHLKHSARILPAFCTSLPARAATAAFLVVLAGAIPFAEVEVNFVVLPLGALLLLSSAFLCFLRKSLLLVAECCALAGIAVLCELPWLVPLPVLFYAALLMDARLPGVAPTAESALLPFHPVLHRTLYAATVVSGTFTAVAKELILG